MCKTTEKPREERRAQVRLKQGDIIELTPALLSSAPLSKIKQSTRDLLTIVVSHDCDIEAAAKTDSQIEIIPIELISKLSPRNTHTRNARTLDLEIQESTGARPQPIRIVASQKQSIHKKDLWDKEFIHPYILAPENLIELTDWLSSRYRRAALPEEFGARFKKIDEDFWDLVQEYNHDLLAILFIFDEGQEKKECAKGEPYTLSISFVFRKGKTKTDLDPLTEKLCALFESNYDGQSGKNAPEIEIRQCLAISESDITLEAYRAGVYMRSEWISYGTDPRGPVISL
jgi:hypothetical protein